MQMMGHIGKDLSAGRLSIDNFNFGTHAIAIVGLPSHFLSYFPTFFHCIAIVLNASSIFSFATGCLGCLTTRLSTAFGSIDQRLDLLSNITVFNIIVKSGMVNGSAENMVFGQKS